MPPSLRQTALNFLARREHSAQELFRKLKTKKFAETEIKELIIQLEKEGLLSNLRFLESFINQRQRKGYGPLRIQAELNERGISEDMIEQVLKINDNAWLIEVRLVWQKRFKNKLPQNFKERAQQMRFLQYRGFTLEQIESVYKSNLNEEPITKKFSFCE